MSDLEDKTRPELVSIAAKKGVVDASKLNKQQLLEALEPVQAAVAAEGDPQPVQIFADPEEGSQDVTEASAEVLPDNYPSPYGRRVVQKAVLYTDGTSGVADLNHERAYEYGEMFQSNDPGERITGDVSQSEAAKAQQSDTETKQANRAKEGYRQ